MITGNLADARADGDGAAPIVASADEPTDTTMLPAPPTVVARPVVSLVPHGPSVTRSTL